MYTAMQQEQQHDIADSSVSSSLIEELESVLHLLQERLAQAASPEHHFALIRLVEGLSLEEWLEITEKQYSREWLALPLDKQEGMPLQALRAVLEKLVHQRDHDVLTGLGNRRLFDRILTFEMQRAARSDTQLSLVLLDIDHFKKVNDTYGHATGDVVLACLGKHLARSVRMYDLAARIGGEEFCLILPGASGLQAKDLTLRILEEFRDFSFEAPNGGCFSVTFSAGIATTTGKTKFPSPSALLDEADGFLYEAKKLGRNRIVSPQTKSPLSQNPALVQAEEKQFLFTGKNS